MKSKTGRISGFLLTDGIFHSGLANKFFNLAESMLISYQTSRCLQGIISYY